MQAVLLAGGKGKRLLPYTTNFPKPLMPVGDKPILELLIQKLKANGIKDIILSTGYLEELIRAYFQDGEKFGVSITYSKEDEPLGTAGPLSLLKSQLKDKFLLMNGDVFSDIDFNDLIKFHTSSHAVGTVALTERIVQIDYGVVEINQEYEFTGWKEKPTIPYWVSTGIYVLEREALELIPDRTFFNLPDLIQTLHAQKKKVSCYPHRGYWIDIGRPEDYERICKEYESQ
jgi:NDP-sugar pyrophosphorylase family protein